MCQLHSYIKLEFAQVNTKSGQKILFILCFTWVKQCYSYMVCRSIVTCLSSTVFCKSFITQLANKARNSDVVIIYYIVTDNLTTTINPVCTQRILSAIIHMLHADQYCRTILILNILALQQKVKELIEPFCFEGE